MGSPTWALRLTMRLLHLALLLLLSCGLVRSQLDFFVNSGGEEEDEETTQAPFLTLDVEVQEEEEVPNGDLHDVPNGDLHEAPNGDTDETEHASEVGEPLAENATSEGGETAMEGDEEEEGGEDEVEESEESGGEESTTLLPVLNFGYIDPSELLGEQNLSALFDTDGQDKAEEVPAEEDVGSPVQLSSEWEVPEKAITAMVVDEETEELLAQQEATDTADAPLYTSGSLPRPRFVMLGQQGVGKSSIANSLLGYDNLANLGKKKNRKKVPFAVGHGLRSKTKMTTFSTGNFLGKTNSPNITVVDTPGFKDQRDTEFVEELMNVLGDEVKEIESFVIVYKYKDRFTSPFARTLRVITKMFGNFWTNVVILVNFWSFNPLHVEDRLNKRVTQRKYGKELRTIFKNKFNLDFELPIVFVDSHYNRSVPEEVEAFNRETKLLWKTSLNRRPFVCLSRGEMQAKLRSEKKDLAEERRRCRAIGKENREFKTVVDSQQRMIESQKLPGMGTCDGDAEETVVCSEQEVCPLENDNSTLLVVLGGETAESGENKHSTSIEIIGSSGLCRHSGVPDLPEPRGKMCAAFDPSGALIVCGGGQRFWRPNNNCWQLIKGFHSNWTEIPNIYPVHGAATAFYRGKFWVMGGSTGDDSYDHTITDKVQAYSPMDQEWSVETSLTSPRHKACAVTIDDNIVITGGTMLGLGKVKPVWLAEIGTRTAEAWDGTSWRSIPSLSRAKVEHGCAVATISGARGVVVVGGATGDDVVEFLDWDIRNTWRTLGKLNRGRGMMPGIGFIGGQLSIVGGYSWPEGVDIVENWDEDREEWRISPWKLQQARYNHGTLTVPGDMFPQCA